MIDIQLIRNNPSKYKLAATNKKVSCNIDLLLSTDEKRSAILKKLQNLQTDRNRLSEQFHQHKNNQDKLCQLRSQIAKIKKNIELLKTELATQKRILDNEMLLVAQPPKDDVPIGKSDLDNKLLYHVGQVPNHESTPFSHIELIEKLNLGNFTKAVNLSGSRSYILKAAGSILEQAVMRLSYDLLLKRSFVPMTVPVLVNFNCMLGTGYFPQGQDQAYIIEKDNMALVGTSEVSLCGFYQKTTFDAKDLPIKMMAWTSCFRREAGSYGKDTKGLYRVHQFQKIEQVIICKPDHKESEHLHQKLLSNSEDILRLLELPYRVVHVCTGDLGQGQYYKHDIEVWMPSRKSYGESHSCSSFNDFQSRRLKIKYRNPETKKTDYCFTLNNTAIASPRILIPLLEIHQTKDGDVKIPKALQKYCDDKKYVSEIKF